MIDIHHHIIYGVDDGAKDKQTMRQMLKAAAVQGVHTLIATSHIAPGIDRFPMSDYYTRLQEAQALCEEMALNLRILPGAEIRYTQQTPAYLAEGSVPTLGGSDKILMEFTGGETYSAMRDAVQRVLRGGFVPVLAHIERFSHLIYPIRNAKALKEDDNVLYQVNAQAIIKGSSRRSVRAIRRLLDDGMIDFVASDAHDLSDRRCQMQDAYNTLVQWVGQTYADQLTGKHATAETLLGSVDEHAIDTVARVYRQKSQMRDARRNIR